MLASRYIEYSERSATKEIVGEVASFLDLREKILQEDVEKGRLAEKLIREEKIALLKEAKSIAETIGLYDYDPRTSEKPLFSRGVKALEAEIQALRNREMGESLNLGPARTVIELQEITRLKNSTTWRSHVSSAQVQSNPYSSSIPVWPNYRLVWSYGLVLGFLFSLLVIICYHQFKKHTLKIKDK